MKKLVALALLVALSLTVAAFASKTSCACGVEEKSAATVSLGAIVPDFTLPDADGKAHTLASLKGSKGTVLIFIATKCPVSNAYNARMAKLAEDYKAKGINVVGINSNVAELADEVKKHAADNNLAFAILKDT